MKVQNKHKIGLVMAKLRLSQAL